MKNVHRQYWDNQKQQQQQQQRMYNKKKNDGRDTVSAEVHYYQSCYWITQE